MIQEWMFISSESSFSIKGPCGEYTGSYLSKLTKEGIRKTKNQNLYWLDCKEEWIYYVFYRILNWC